MVNRKQTIEMKRRSRRRRRMSNSNSEDEEMVTQILGKKRKIIHNDQKVLWSDLPLDLLELIKKRLFFIDQRNFRLVCKSWSSIDKFPPSKQMPWLLVFDDVEDKTNSSCKLVDPASKKTYTIDMKAIKEKMKINNFESMKVYESKYGWLLSSHNHNQVGYNTNTTTTLFLYSPFFNENNFIELPALHNNKICFATFTSSPLQEDCLVLAMSIHPQNKLQLSICRCGDKSWNTRIFMCSFQLSEVEYWMYSDNILYYATRVQRKISVFAAPLPIKLYGDGALHIVKSDGQLFLILEKNVNSTWCHFVPYIYRLDQSGSWKKVKSLGDRHVLFIGDGYNTIVKMGETDRKEIPNRIYYCSGLELKYCNVCTGSSSGYRSYVCTKSYGSLATKCCRKVLIDPPSHNKT